MADSIAILVTRRCNMTCAHCSVESGPRVDTADPSEEQLLKIVRESAAAGVHAVQFTGGEPMMRQKVVLRLMDEAHRLGMASGLTTNGFWGKNPRTARALLKQMMGRGLQYMAVSYDRYHAEFMGPEPVLAIATAAHNLGFFFNVNVTRTLQDENLDEYARVFGNLPNVRMRLYDVQPVGRARKFDLPNLRAETEGFCNSATQATFTEDGRMIACNGPSYFDPPESPRYIGDTATESVATLLERHTSDPIIDTLRTFGPAGLRDELQKDDRFASSFDRRFSGQCDLCHHVTGNPEMVGYLREHLDGSAHQALRAAKWRMITAAKASGELTREHVNGPGVARIFMAKVTTGQWPENTPHLLGRADIDWDHLAKYLSGCGMAKQLAPAATQDHIARWAPAYFAETLRARAMRDALRELSHRETLEKIHTTLCELNLTGTLLKGAALYLLEQVAGIDPMRVPGDIDLWVETEAAASALRRQLIANGFEGDAAAPRTGPHHLAPVCWRGSSVEIHTGIMPSFWGLPEDRMAAEARAIPGWSAFKALSWEDMVLHEAIHNTTHLYGFGLKLALDVFRINRLADVGAGGAIDWKTVAENAWKTRCPMAFWAPLAGLEVGMPGLLPVPGEFWDGAPRGKRWQRMKLVAFKRLFTAVDNADDMNPFTRNGIFLLLHDGNLRRIRYLVELGTGPAAESRRTAMAGQSGQSWKMLGTHLRSAWHDIQAFRRATGRRL